MKASRPTSAVTIALLLLSACGGGGGSGSGGGTGMAPAPAPAPVLAPAETAAPAAPEASAKPEPQAAKTTKDLYPSLSYSGKPGETHWVHDGLEVRKTRDGQPPTRLLGKELCILAWAIEQMETTKIPVAVRNWLALRPEERWSATWERY